MRNFSAQLRRRAPPATDRPRPASPPCARPAALLARLAYRAQPLTGRSHLGHIESLVSAGWYQGLPPLGPGCATQILGQLSSGTSLLPRICAASIVAPGLPDRQSCIRVKVVLARRPAEVILTPMELDEILGRNGLSPRNVHRLRRLRQSPTLFVPDAPPCVQPTVAACRVCHYPSGAW